ncbi:hypothetical protein B0T21DRAFT_347788 [Apiosordaria backusii]|uniref:Uncharacterized protein n=1 Tax=Apiosordaria backusii TaxID=314023 RepID=A0AA40BNE5_9PEZI|nr:hypothetical protein B0T21DRAFT_347788 [Apiosordaria backusii]
MNTSSPSPDDTSSFVRTPLLSPLDAANLTSQGLLHPGTTPNTHLLHKHRLFPFAEEEYRDFPLHNTTPTSHPSAFALLPRYLISSETLQYIGLSPTKARELWSSHESSFWPRNRKIDPAEFLTFVLNHVTNRKDTWSEDESEWHAVLEDCGVNDDVKDAIMDPRFEQIRGCETCLGWVKDTVEMRFRGLRRIQEQSQACEGELKKTMEG